VNALPVITPANTPAGADAHIVHTLSPDLVSDEECTMEAIDRRANHVGSVLDGIITDMEKHRLEGAD